MIPFTELRQLLSAGKRSLARAGRSLSRTSAVGIALGVALGLPAAYLALAIVDNLIGPLIGLFVGKPQFELNSFTIDSSEFRYGFVLEELLAFVLVAALAHLVLSSRRADDQAASADSHPCPECTRLVPVAAKRCPYCTSHLPTPES